MERKLKHYIREVTTIKVPFALEDMKEDVDIEGLESTCKKLESVDPQCLSARFVDKNGEPVFYYFGKRIKKTDGKPGVRLYLISGFTTESINLFLKGYH